MSKTHKMWLTLNDTQKPEIHEKTEIKSDVPFYEIMSVILQSAF